MTLASVDQAPDKYDTESPYTPLIDAAQELLRVRLVEDDAHEILTIGQDLVRLHRSWVDAQ